MISFLKTRRNFFVAALFGLTLLKAQPYNWVQLPAAPVSGGKQDGICFINKDTGWVVNGTGKIYKTMNGGSSWVQQKNSAGTYFRSITFIDDQTGFAGNIGTNYFPGVTDTHPLYRTVDGGNSWAPVTSSIAGSMPAGICAIQPVNASVIYAAGRVGSPPVIIKSTDGGATWTGTDLSAHCSMILDLYFHSADTGYIFAGNNANINLSNASILRTTDGGATWSNVYTSARPTEIIWKAWFPSHETGYATIQSYNSGSTQRFIAKTVDGGLSWSELPLVNSGIREFGICFMNDTVGWVGGENTGYETRDGGLTWQNKNIGQYANKFSNIKNPDGSSTCYAVGLSVFKMNYSFSTTGIHKEEEPGDKAAVFPNPVHQGSYISLALDKTGGRIIKAEIINLSGKTIALLFDAYFPGVSESPFTYQLPAVVAGEYLLKFIRDDNKVFTRPILISD